MTIQFSMFLVVVISLRTKEGREICQTVPTDRTFSNFSFFGAIFLTTSGHFFGVNFFRIFILNTFSFL
jgi:hypothetical protein